MAGVPVPAGVWVRIHRVELTPPERAPGLPEDSASVPFETWINGWLVEDASIGSRASIRTPAGRVVEGDLVEAEPAYEHSFGSPPQPLQRAGERAREQLFAKGRS